jgi:hypothetical protein
MSEYILLSDDSASIKWLMSLPCVRMIFLNEPPAEVALVLAAVQIRLDDIAMHLL